MNTLLYKTITAALFSFISLAAQHTSAEEPPQPYHIEVIVFERLATAYDAPEYWRKDFALAYPPNYRLIQPYENILPSNNADAAEINNVEPEQLTANIESLSPEDSLTIINEPARQRSARALPERPAETYILNAQANSVDRKNQMRVLFHKAWQQALIATEKAPYVVLTGGEVFDGVHELGGTIRLSVQKFIHVDTQLWLTQFGPNYGQESEWPIIPLAPSLSAQHQEQQDLLSHTDQAPAEYGINQDTMNAIKNTSTFSGTVFSPGSFNSPLKLNNRLDAVQQRQYLANEVIVLEQSRRMRSQELHYIDHPRLGILIKIIPLSFEEAAKLAPNSDAI